MSGTAIKMSMDSFNSTQNTGKTASKKSTTEIYSSTASNHVAAKKNNFDDSLKQASNKSDNSYKVKKDETRYEKKDTENDKVDDEVKDEVKEKIDNLSDKDISEILANILNLLNNYINNKNSDDQGNVNNDILDAILNKLNGSDSSNTDMSKLIQQLMDSMKNNDVSNALSSDSLNFMEELLSKLSADLGDNNKLLNSDLKTNINNLISQISDMAAEKQGDKVLGLEEMLNKNFSQDNQSLLDQQSDDAMGNADKSSSKEDDFLNKFLGKDDDAASAKINMFATRQSIQTQSVQSTENLSLNKLTFADDLIKDVKFMATNSIKELTVKVNPGNLGEITIKLIQQDGLMKANLKANSKETAALLAQNVEEIKSQLSNQDVKIAEVNIELYQEDTTFFSHEGFEGELSKQGNNSNSNGSINKVEGGLEDVVDENIEAIDNSNVNFLA